MEIEAVIVDDGSTDESWNILEAWAKKDSRVRPFRHEQNQGKGAAIRTAIQKAVGDIAVIQDADLEYDPQDYPRLLAPILNHGADVVYGSRFAATEYRRVLMFWHSLANNMLTTLSNILTDLNLTDMETGYKAFRMSILKTMPLRSNRFGIEPEITAKIARRGLVIYETPVRYSGRTYVEGKKIGLKDAFQALWVMLKYRIIDDSFEARYGEQILREMAEAPRYSKWLMRTIRPFFSGVLLEVGAGIGNNIRALSGARKLIATDADPEYVRMLENSFGGRRDIRILHWDILHAAPAELEPVETILCSNVLEHIEEDGTALVNMHAALKTGGRLLLIVPACERLFGVTDKALGHYRRYSRASLAEKLKQAGFTVEFARNINKTGAVGWWFNSKILGRKTLSRSSMKLFNLIVPIARALDPFLPWTGLSLVVVAKKDAGATSRA